MCEEDAERIDLSPEYLAWGRDTASRSRIYQEMIADEASRPAVSLARVYFAGRARFVRRMERRFGLTRPDVLLERARVGGGVVLVGPRPGKGSVRPE